MFCNRPKKFTRAQYLSQPFPKPVSNVLHYSVYVASHVAFYLSQPNSHGAKCHIFMKLSISSATSRKDEDGSPHIHYMCKITLDVAKWGGLFPFPRHEHSFKKKKVWTRCGERNWVQRYSYSKKERCRREKGHCESGKWIAPGNFYPISHPHHGLFWGQQGTTNICPPLPLLNPKFRNFSCLSTLEILRFSNRPGNAPALQKLMHRLPALGVIPFPSELTESLDQDQKTVIRHPFSKA